MGKIMSESFKREDDPMFSTSFKMFSPQKYVGSTKNTQQSTDLGLAQTSSQEEPAPSLPKTSLLGY